MGGGGRYAPHVVYDDRQEMSTYPFLVTSTVCFRTADDKLPTNAESFAIFR